MAAGGREPGGFEAGASACLRLASLTMALHCVQSRWWASRQLLVAQPLPPTRPSHSTVLAHALHRFGRPSRAPLPTQGLPPTPSHGFAFAFMQFRHSVLWPTRQLLVAQPLPSTPLHSTVRAHALHSLSWPSRQPLPTQPLAPEQAH